MSLQNAPAHDPAIFHNTPIVVFLAILTAFLRRKKM
jgi:hypothetical protein